jgi:indole-3-acetate monooxygenase
MTLWPDTSNVLDLPELLRPLIADCAADADRHGDIPADLHAALRESGAFRLLTPLELGGWEAPLPTTLEVCERFGRIDGSVGLLVWNANFGFVGAVLDDLGTERVWAAGGEPVFANSGMPCVAERVNGGYRVAGHWKIVTGIDRADWLVTVGAVVSADDQTRTDRTAGSEVRLVLIPRDQLQILGSWNVTGMRATRSRDVATEAAFVPQELSAPFDQPSRIDRPLYRGFVPQLVFGRCAAVTLGVAARAIDETVALVRSKRDVGERVSAVTSRTQYLTAKAQAAVDAARLLLMATAGKVQHDDRGTPTTLEHRAAFHAATTHAADVSREALVAMYQLAGSSALYRDNSIEKIFRAGMAIAQHANQSSLFMEAAGRVRFGLDPAVPLF